MELEAGLEERCCDFVRKNKGMALKIIVKGVRGFPDRLILLQGGKLFFVEFKRPVTGVVAALQLRWHRALRRLGVPVYLIDTYKDFLNAYTQES